MKTISECLKILVENISIDDAPINILIDGKLHDIEEFYFDAEISEYVMKLTDGYDYEESEYISNIEDIINKDSD